MTAFGGNTARKEALLATALAEGDGAPPDLAAHGYPPALAALLDAVADLLGRPDERTVFQRGRIAVVPPGADLAPVATGAMLHLLGTPEWRRWRSDVIERLIASHRAALVGGAPDWRSLQTAVMAAGDAAGKEEERRIARGWEAACWPAAEGRSVLVSTLDAWWSMIHAEDWSEELDERGRHALEAIWDEQQPTRAAGGDPDYAALFRAREPDLSARFEENLARDNRHRAERVTALAAHLLTLMANATVPR